ncbi:hypothetical protein [Rhizobium leguminosarum]|uniref:Uncharacterized protein n=1 Tax=Rhizobium leguminosarum TaxID=384 RepID=A0A7K3VJ17_RHILE|nr:hypothetical protein [Rhizobium leguminosarum]NEK17159.1 hypothetical protein [Rhizobium leguminosarum]
MAATLFTLMVIGGLSYSRPPKPYVAISATSEYLSYRVARPPISAIPLVEAAIRSTNLKCLTPFTGLLEPERGAIVRYRSGGDRIAIQVDAGDKVAATLRSEGEPDCQVTGSLTVVLESKGYIRALPIAGPADIGIEFAAPALPRVATGDGQKFEQVRNIMWEGSVQAFTRGYLSGGLSPKADAEFTLPAGGRISSGDSLVPSQDDQNITPWYGIAEITEKGFKVSATTTSLDLKLYRPGTNLGDAETFRLDFLANIFSDPGIIWLAIVFAVFSYIVQILAAWMGLWRPAKERTNTGARS